MNPNLQRKIDALPEVLKTRALARIQATDPDWAGELRSVEVVDDAGGQPVILTWERSAAVIWAPRSDASNQS